MLSPEHREAVLAFYAFARMADDIADAPDLKAAEKLQRLDALEQALVAGDPAIPQAARLHAADSAAQGRASCRPATCCAPSARTR